MSVLESYARLRGERWAVPRPRPATEDRMRRLPRVRHSARAWVRRTVVLLMVIESLAAGAVGTVQILGRPGPVVGAGRGLRRPVRRVAAAARHHGHLLERVFGTGSDEYRRVGRAGCCCWHWPASSPTRAAWTSPADPRRSLSRSSPWSPSSTGSPPVSGCATCGHVGAAPPSRRGRPRGRRPRPRRQLERQRYAGLQVVAACVTAADRSACRGPRPARRRPRRRPRAGRGARGRHRSR
jgi:hypothetical protein